MNNSNVKQNVKIGFDPNEDVLFLKNGNNIGLTVNEYGNIGIGMQGQSANLGYNLAVNGTIGAKEVVVENTSAWPDYVFKPEYPLTSLDEVKKHIDEKGHLPNIPSAQEVQENGISLGEMNRLLLEKVEELTLYVIDIKEKNEAEIEALKAEIQNFKK